VLPKRKAERGLRTFKGREATAEQQLEIAKLALAEEECGQCLGLRGELGVTRGVAREQVFEDAAVGRVRHSSGVDC
jgi:hypothetical protein